jgi:hypothetical protein
MVSVSRIEQLTFNAFRFETGGLTVAILHRMVLSGNGLFAGITALLRLEPQEMNHTAGRQLQQQWLRPRH